MLWSKLKNNKKLFIFNRLKRFLTYHATCCVECGSFPHEPPSGVNFSPLPSSFETATGLSRRRFLAGGAVVFSGISMPGISLADEWLPLGETSWPKTTEFTLHAPVSNAIPLTVSTGNTPLDGIRNVIASAEAGRAHYDAVNHGARHKPPARPTALTLAQIDVWIRSTPGQPHAIGRYQFIPNTLYRLQRKGKLSLHTTFSPQVQDYLADILIYEAGYPDLARGRLGLSDFQDNLAKIWAGLPLRNGRSAYHGYAGNRATVSRAWYDAQMKSIFRTRF